MQFNKLHREAVSCSVLLLLIFAFKSTFAANYTVPTGSMIPTIEPGDKLFVNQMAYDLRIPFTRTSLFRVSDPSPGEVVVLDAPDQPGIRYVKRLIGKPGDHLEVNNGFIKINGEPLPTSLHNEEEMEAISSQGGLYEETLNGKKYQVQRLGYSPSYPPLKFEVPANCYFFMGDNRENSIDSRKWGCARRDQILGQAKLVYFSFDWPKVRWERIGNMF